VRRVLRGGVFVDDERSVRCACRDRDDPRYCFGDYGFRLCVVSQRD
jgi:formylglycine-generating enzyme required for sulfatase activity